MRPFVTFKERCLTSINSRGIPVSHSQFSFVSVILLILLQVGCFTSQPVEQPQDLFPVVSLPDMSIDADGNVLWSPNISITCDPGIPTRLGFNITREGNEKIAVLFVLNLKKKTTIVNSSGGMLDLTAESNQLLTSHLKLEPGDFDYEAMVTVNTDVRTLKGKIHVAAK